MCFVNGNNIIGGSFLVSNMSSEINFIPEGIDDETKLIAKTAKDFMLRSIMPNESAIDKLDINIIKKIFLEAGEIGILGIEVPEIYNGLSLNKKVSLVVIEELGKQTSFSVSYGTHVGIGTMPIVYFGSVQQKSYYLPLLTSGRKIAAYALTESDAGSDALSVKTKAVLEGEYWVLNGNKMWITNAGLADIFIIFAKVDGRKLTAFIVERGDPGFSIGPEEAKLGLRGSSTCSLILNECRIPKNRLLGKIGYGHRVAFGALNVGRLKLGASCVGAMKAVLEHAIKYVCTREQFGRKIYTFGLIKQKIVDIAIKIFVAESINFRTSSYIDECVKGNKTEIANLSQTDLEIINDFAIEISIGKIWCSEALFTAVDDALQCFGGYGFSVDYPIEKFYRDNRINRIFEGTNEINRLIIVGDLFKKIGCNMLDLLTNDRSMNLLSFNEDIRHLNHAVSLAKKMCCHVINVALKKYKPVDLLEMQELSTKISDMLMDLYTMESSIIRSAKLIEIDHSLSALSYDLVSIYVNRTWYKIQSDVQMFLVELLSGESLVSELNNIKNLICFMPTNYAKSRDRIVEKLIKNGCYPMCQY